MGVPTRSILVVSAASHARRESVRQAESRLRAQVRRYERRYECPSATMAEAVRHGLVKETAEISKWLSALRVLESLQRRPANGRTTGTRTKTT